MAAECLADRRAETPHRISNGRLPRRSHMKRTLLLSAAIAAAIFAFAESAGAQQNPTAPPQGRGAPPGRGARPQGPPGPVPRLPDGHPDLTGIWNGFAAVGGVALTDPVHGAGLQHAIWELEYDSSPAADLP